MLGRRSKTAAAPAAPVIQTPPHASPPVSKAAQVEAELADARQDLASAQTARAAAQAEYTAAADGARLTEAIAAKVLISEADVAIDVAGRIIARLEAELTELLEGAANAAAAAERDHLRAEAEAALAAYRVAFGERMPTLTESLRGLIRLWAQAELARDAAAAVGVALPSADDFRHRHGTPRVDLGRRELDLWLNPYDGTPFGDDHQREIRARPDGVGVLAGHGYVHEATQKRRYVEVTFHPLTVGEVAPALFEALIPSAAGGGPAGWSPLRSGTSPRAVLAALDALAAREAAGPHTAPKPRTERRALEAARDVRVNPNPAPFREYFGPYGAESSSEAATA